MAEMEKTKTQQQAAGLLALEREIFLDKAGKYENFRIAKNVVIIGMAFMFQFTAFHGTANLQSSINADGAIGTYTLAAIYLSLIVSNIFLPVIVIRTLGCKWTMAVSFIAYMPFIISQLYPRMYTLIPSGLVVGFGGGPLWCAKCTYLTVIAEALAILNGKDGKSDAQVVRFFGLFFIFYQMAQVWGNLISSSVLSFGESSIIESTNITINNDAVRENVAKFCGAAFCPGITAAVNPNLQAPDHSKIQIIMLIFFGMMVGACLLIAFAVDGLKRYEMGRKGSGSELSGVRLLSVTMKQLMQVKQILLLPITMFIGAEQAFMIVDFTNAFIACGWGIPRIGYVMICFGISNTIAAALASAIAKVVGRNKILMLTLVLHGSLLIWMRQWIAVPNDIVAYCSMAALWGLLDGTWLVIINSYYGILFRGREEAAFSNFRLFESCGSVIMYSLSPILCAATKIEAICCLMIVGMVGYGIVEYMENRDKSKNAKEITPYKQAKQDTRF